MLSFSQISHVISYQTVGLVTVQLSEMIIFLPRRETEFCSALLLRTELIVTEGQIRNEIICPSAYYSTLSSLTERTYKLFVNPVETLNSNENNIRLFSSSSASLKSAGYFRNMLRQTMRKVGK